MRLLTASFFALLFTAAILAQDAAPAPPGVKVLRNVEYVPGAGASRSLDLYLPEKAAKPVPLVIWIHGGAWRGGSKEGNQALVLMKDGFATASINYRLSQEAVFPAQIFDCKAAIRFLRSHASEYGIDPERIGVWGSSAGGHLAALLGTTSGVQELRGNDNVGVTSRVQAVCDFFGPADLLTMAAQSGPESRIQHDTPDCPEALLIGGAVMQVADKAWAASPVKYVSEDDPPFLIVHGDQDPLVPVSQSWELHGTLQKAGAKSAIHIVKGGGHGDRFDAKEINALVREFFVRVLKPAGK